MRTLASLLPSVLAAVVLAPRVFGHGDTHEIIAALTQQIAAKPTAAELYLRRGQMYRLHGDVAAAAADFDQTEKLNPALAEVDLGRGEMLTDAGKIKEAKVALDRFIKRQPQHPGGYLSRARALVQEGAYAAAADDFAHAATLLPEPDPSLFIDCARALERADRVDEAVRVLDAAIAQRGPLVVLMQTALEIEEASGKIEEALARVDKLIAASPRKERWLARKGALLEENDRAAEARDSFIDAQKALATVPPTRRNSAAMIELAKNIETALKRLETPGPR